jgi:hypothetical protein
MDEALVKWCDRWLGSAVSEIVFEAGSLSAVAGVRLADGREVVVKARRSAPRLQAAYAVHRHVWQCGYPAPEPLVPPVPLDAAQSASAEQLVCGGLSPSPSWVAWDHDEPGLWPTTDGGPGNLNLVAGPGWLDEAAARCRRRLSRYQAPRVIGHADWHADNVRWSGGRLLVVHDWDSLVSQPEAVIAGIAAAIFPASEDAWQPATIRESEQFLSAYIRASTRVWTPMTLRRPGRHRHGLSPSTRKKP